MPCRKSKGRLEGEARAIEMDGRLFGKAGVSDHGERQEVFSEYLIL